MTKASHKLSGLFADRYTIERKLGRGGSATVYLARDNRQDREIALKVLDNELAYALGAKRFLQEIHITSRLQHPHILPIHDSGEWEGLLFYVLPFVAGESLRARLDREKQLPIEECVRLTCDVASALAHAHSKGVIHRDVKPENILLSEGHALIADFGIARTIDIHTGERLTSSGLIVGTSQYMSPEQASGEREIDARSDIYSLGCVLYEMLAGIEPFVGPNAQAVIAQRFTHTPRPVSMFRSTVPERIEDALIRALAISPADRYQTMKAFAADLPAVAGTGGERRRTGRKIRDLMRTKKGKGAVVAATTVAALLIAALIPSARNASSLFSSNPAVDSSLYFVLSPAESGAAGAATTSERGDALHNALAQWKGIALVTKVKVQDAIKRAGVPEDLSAAKQLALSAGAGKLVWGKADGSSPNGRYQFSLVDLVTDSVREVNVSRDSALLGDAVALALLRDPAWPADAYGAEARTRSYPALRAYGDGHTALKSWNTSRSTAHFKAAALHDPGFVAARYWSAQLQLWTDAGDWTRDALFAASRSEQLSTRDASLARALGAMAAKNYPAACTEYRSIIARDSMEFLAWHGLGECLRRDNAVIASSRSVSNWEFRSSYRAAAEALMRAVQLEPGAHAIVDFADMQLILAISPSRVRRGADGTGAFAFAAFPSLSADTLSYVPYPLKLFAALPFTAVRGRDEALERNAKELEKFAISWITSSPANPDGYEALATVLEARGNIAPRIAGQRSASDALAKALSLAATPEQRTRIAATEVRLRIKRGEFRDANRLADSLLQVSSARDSGEMIVVSGFVGRTRIFSRFAQKYDGWLPTAVAQYTIPAELRVNTSELFATAALGECTADVTGLRTRVEQNIESYITPEKRDGLRQILTARTLSLLTPCTGGRSALDIRAESPLQRAQQAFGQKKYSVTRMILDSLAAGRINTRPGDLSLDYYFQEAWLRSSIGDSVAAARQLDRALNALGALSATAMKEPAAAAALGRVIRLRAELAARAGDAATAVRWMNAFDLLYTGADPPLRRGVEELKVLVARNGKR